MAAITVRMAAGVPMSFLPTWGSGTKSRHHPGEDAELGLDLTNSTPWSRGGLPHHQGGNRSTPPIFW